MKYIAVLVIAIAALVGLGVYQRFAFFDGKLHMVFCSVGQGDAIFIRTPESKNIIIDGGPDNKIIGCLSRHMPFWERNIDLVILTHPHADHLNGFHDVFAQYKVLAFSTEDITNPTATFEELLRLVKEEKLKTQHLVSGNRLKIHDVVLTVVGPSQSFLHHTSPNGTIGESSEFGSLETLLSYGSFHVLFTGDSQALELKEAIRNDLVSKLTVLQVPHHGSKTGLDKEILDVLSPELAVISVGKNKYGHPSKEIIKILSDKDIKILRTDEIGDIEIVSDGKTWQVMLD